MTTALTKAPTTALAAHPILELDRMVIRRDFWVFAGAKFRIYDDQGVMIGFCKQKAFKLREDIRVFTDASMTTELLNIHARQIIDFGAAYDVSDSVTGEPVGSLRRRGMKSILKDEWIVLDTAGDEIGRIKEDNAGLAMLRRFLSTLIPQKFYIHVEGARAGELRQHFNPFLYRATLDLGADRERALDRRLALGAAVLLAAIEGRQG